MLRVPCEGEGASVSQRPAVSAARPAGRIGRVWRTATAQGPRALVWKGLWDLDGYRHCIVALGLRHARREPNRPPRIPVTAGTLAPDQLEEYLTLRPDQTRDAIAARFDRGDICFVARDGTRLIGAAWTALHWAPAPFLHCSIALAPDTSYGYDDYVLPEYRRNGVLRPVGDLRHDALLDRGFYRNVAIIWPQNVAALTRHRQGTEETVGVMGCVRLGAWSRPFVRWDPAHVSLDDPPFRITPP